MSTALSIILVIAVVLVVGLMRDSLRLGAVTRWGRTHGFSRVLQPEHDNERLTAWAKRFHPDSVSHWGIVLRGEAAGLATTIAEHEEDRRSSADRWHTQAAAIDAWPHDAELAAVDDYVLVRVPGLITAGRLDGLLASADAALGLFTEAAARMSRTMIPPRL